MGAGAKHRLVFTDRLLATLVHLRHGTTHDVPACWFGVDRSTITRAINEVRPLLAERGCTISPDVRLRTLAEVVDHLGATGKTGIIDGTEIRVLRPAQGRKDRDKFISGKNKQNAVKLVGLGCPRQEAFVHAMRPLLPMPLLAVGAAFDYHAGNLHRPPLRVGKRLWTCATSGAYARSRASGV